MDFARIEMQEETPGRSQQPARLPEPGFDELEKVIEPVGESRSPQFHGAIAMPAEPGPVAVPVADHADPRSRLFPTGVEWRINVDQIERTVLESRENLQVVSPVDLQVGHAPSAPAARPFSG